MQIRTMTSADIPFGMRLTAQNHWNQREADWCRQLALEPTGNFIAEQHGEPAGIACCCTFGDIAWINMVLVDQRQRGQGIGTALMQHVLHHLNGVPCVRLDATPLGQPVYTKLGFVAEYTLDRWAGIPQAPANSPTSGVAPLTLADLPTICALDRIVTKTDRTKLLQQLLDENPRFACKYAPHGTLKGFCMSRPGANAWQIGPLSGSTDAGRALLCAIATQFVGEKVYLDIPTTNADAVEVAKTIGLSVQRSFLRMSRGQRLYENMEMLWTSFGPEKG